MSNSDDNQSGPMEAQELAAPADYDRFFLGHQQIVLTETAMYRNQRMLGRGGNGTTFLVTGIQGPLAGIQFALKVFHKISDRDRRRAFLDEIEYYKTLAHPAIIRFYDDGEFTVGERTYSRRSSLET